MPEGNETYTVEISSVASGAEIGAVNTMQLVILANDEPHGNFQFVEVSKAMILSYYIVQECN